MRRAYGTIAAWAVACAIAAPSTLASAAPAWRFSEQAPAPKGGAGGVGMVLDGRAEGGRSAGVVVARVVPGGPAASAGVRPGDRIVGVAGKTLPPDATVATVALLIRGPIGSKVTIAVQGKSDPAPRQAEVERVAMESLFPTRVARPVEVQAGVALVASGANHTVGVHFLDQGRPGALVRYAWAVAPSGAALDAKDAMQGESVVVWTGAGATVQVADLRVDLAIWPSRSVLVASASNLPVVVTDAARWRSLDPSAQKVQTLRAPPKTGVAHWPEGPCTLRVAARIGQAPVVLHRLTVDLRSATGEVMPSATVLTDADGEATLSLPAGTWTIVGIRPAKGGGHRDLAYAAKLVAPSAATRCDDGATAQVPLALEALPPVAAGALPAQALNHPLVGKPMPEIAVRRWLGEGAAAPAKGEALLLYAWATWCGPCKRTSPEIAELAARRAGKGLRVVLASADRDEAALEDYVAALPPDGPPVAWCGPDLLDPLEARGIPTVMVVDAGGIVRAVHTGSGVAIETWERFLDSIASPPEATPAGTPKAVRKPRPTVGKKR
ncbi:MAG: hypothetical protein RIT45_3891 [Pseudomonadota bacterium]